MTTIGWLFILVAILLIRQVTRGRVMNLGEDLSDTFLAVVKGDSDALGEILTRTGDANTPVTPDDAIAKESPTGGSGLSGAAVELGKAAKGYRWAATGPDYYDCSGLMYRAAQKVGYKGTRFTTASLPGNRAFKKISGPNVEGPGIVNAGTNDIVLWPAGSGGITGHMGVITSPNKFYSARSVRSGIGESPINTFRKTTPVYYRLTISHGAE